MATMNQKNKRIRIAVQKKGRLMDPSLEFLKKLGLKFEPNCSKLINNCLNADIELLYVRNNDIPQYVKYGTADYAIVGENVLLEKKCRVEILKRLGFGKCSLVIAVPQKSKIKNIYDLAEERIATSYANTLKCFLKEKKINASMIEIEGSVEICPILNLADAICDITQSGQTLRENGLKIIEKILDSEAVLIKSPYLNEEKMKTFENLLTK